MYVLVAKELCQSLRKWLKLLMHTKLSLSPKNSLGFYGIEVHCLKVTRTDEEVAPHRGPDLGVCVCKITVLGTHRVQI